MSDFIKAQHGKCRVPMWSGGMPSGFCDQPAFGEHIEGERFRDAWTGHVRRFDGAWDGLHRRRPDRCDERRTGMSDAERKYMDAVRALNAAAYAALRAAADTTELPNVNRHLLRGLARTSDLIVDAGLETAKEPQP